MVMLQGSGPTNRDGNQAPMIVTNLLKQIADDLAAHGIATLRFDKRGMYANSAELPADQNKLSDFFRFENFVSDARAAHDFLSNQPQLDPKRIGILGHSEGGLLALIVADQLQDEGHAPATLILIGTAGRPLDLVLNEQLEHVLSTAPPTHAKSILDSNQRIVKSIRGNGTVPSFVVAELQSLYPAYLGKFLQSEFAQEPAKLAARFSGPVYVINGEKDIQVSAERDSKVLEDALKSRKVDVHEMLIVAGASHNLKVLAGPGDPGFAGDVAPGVLGKIAAWCDSKLK